MPKSTFLKLPHEKRNRIVESALDEFSARPYRQASLSQVVIRAGIAKGSMYQYFMNKFDLYQWLVTEELERRRDEWLQTEDSGPLPNHDSSTGLGLFAALERTILIQIGFMLAHPRLARLAASAREPTGDEELRELHGALRREQIDGLVERIRAAQAAGEVRSSIDARSLAHFIDAFVVHGTTNAVLDRLGRLGRLGMEAHGLRPATERNAGLSSEERRALVAQGLDLIRDGIREVAGSGDARHHTRPRPLDWCNDEPGDPLELPTRVAVSG